MKLRTLLSFSFVALLVASGCGNEVSKPTSLVFTVQPTTVSAGTPFAPTIKVSVRDDKGSVAASWRGTVHLSIGTNPADGELAGATSANAVNGVATFDGLVLQKAGVGYTLKATAEGLTAADSSAFNITAGAASSLSITAQPTSVMKGEKLGTITVAVLDRFGGTVADSDATIEVDFGNNPRGAALSGTRSVKASGGIATFSDLAVDQDGNGFTLRFTSGALTPVTSNSFSIGRVGASKLSFTAAPTTTQAGKAFSPGLVISAVDTSGNVDPQYSGPVTITLGANPGQAFLSGALSANAVNGVARFDFLSLDKVGSGYTIVATADALTTATSAAITVTPGTPKTVLFKTQPTNITAGQLLAPAVTVAIVDSYGNIVADSLAPVTLIVARNGALLTSRNTNAVAGVAEFADVEIDVAGQGYTLTAFSDGLTSAVSDPFEVLPGSAASLLITQQASSVVAGEKLRPGVQVAVVDALGNIVTSGSNDVTVALSDNPTNAQLAGTFSVKPTVGIATFDDLVITKASTGYTLSLQTTGLTPVKTSAFEVVPAATSQLVITTQPSSTLAGTPFSPVVTVSVQDQFGNVVTNSAASVALSLTGAASGTTLSGTPRLTAIGGVATFTDLNLQKVGTGYQIVAAAGPFTSTASTAFDITPGPAAKVGFVEKLPDMTAGGIIQPDVHVAIQDQYGNLVATSAGDITVDTDGQSGSTVTGTLTQTTTGGVATFTDLVLTKSRSAMTLVAKSNGLADGISNTFRVSAAGAVALRFDQAPTNATAGFPFNPTVTVAAVDTYGNRVRGFTAPIALELGTNTGSVTLSGTKSVIPVNGLSTYSDINVQKTGTGFTIVASTTGLPSMTSAPFNVSNADPAKLGYLTAPADSVAGTPIASGIRVAVQDSFGNTITTSSNPVTLAFVANGAGGTLAGTLTQNAVNGIATFPDVNVTKVGTGYTIGASSTGLTSVTSAAFAITPAAASKLAVTTQPSTTYAAGATISATVTVQDTYGNTITGTPGALPLTLALSTNAGNATLQGTGTTMNSTAGVAAFTNVNVQKVGTGYTLSATSPGLTAATSSAFAITPATANKLAFTVQPPATALSGATYTPAVQVTIQDTYSNIVTTATTSLTLALGNPNGATLAGTVTVSATAGVANFGTINVQKVGTGYTLIASGTSLTSATSTAFSITPGAASKLAFTTSPAATATATAVGTPNVSVVVAVQDANGNTVTTSTANVAVTLGNANGATLAGTTTVAAVNGVATFSALNIQKSGTAYTIGATSGTLTAATSSAFNITAATAAQLGFTAQPTSAVAGVTISPTVTIAVQDAFGNTVTTSSASVVVALNNANGATLAGTLTVSASSGVASFSTLNIQKAGTGYTLGATSGALTVATSSAFNITAAAATKLGFTTQPASTITAGATFAPVVAVQDTFGNTVTSSTASVVLTLTNANGAILAGTTTLSAASGVANFSTLSIQKTGTAYTLSATTPAGLTGATSTSFNVSAATASKLAFNVQPSTATAGSNFTPAMTVLVQDTYGNTVTGTPNVDVTLTVTGSASPFTGTSTTTVTSASGVATFTAVGLTKSGTFTLVASGTGVTAATSSSFTVNSGAAAKVAFTTPPVTSNAGVALAPVVAVQDSFGNAVTTSSAPVTVTLNNANGATLLGASSLNAASGVASFGALSIQKVGTGYSLTADSSGLTSATSSSFDITPAAPAKLAFGTQPGNIAAGGTISPAVSVQVLDQYGNLASGSTAFVTIGLTGDTNGTLLSGTKNVMAINGTATFSNLSIQKGGTYTLSALSGSLTTATSASFDVTAAPATAVTVTTAPSATAAGSLISPAVKVSIVDQYGNVDTSSTVPVTLALATNPTGDTLSGTKTVNAVAGVATFGDLSLTKAATGYSFLVTSGSLQPAVSPAFAINGATPTALVVVSQPSNALAGVAISPAVKAELRDTYGNVANTSTAAVSIALANNPSAATLFGTTGVNAVAGVATFSGLNVQKVGAGYTLTVTSGALPTATTGSFDITPAAASQLVFATGPSDAVAGTNITPAIKVEVRDAYANVATSATGAVTLAFGSNPAGGTLYGTLTTNASGGIATFSDINVQKAGSGYTLAAMSASLTAASSGAFNITAAAPASLAFGTQPSGADPHATISPAVTVQVSDAFGNTASGAVAITIALGNNLGGATLAGTTTQNSSAGVATFSNLAVDKAQVDYTLVASGSGLSSATSNAFDVAPAALRYAESTSRAVNLVRNPASTDTTIVLDLVTTQEMTASQATLTLPLDTSKVVPNATLLTAGAALQTTVAPYQFTDLSAEGVLTVVVATDDNSSVTVPAGSLLFTIRLDLKAGATRGLAFAASGADVNVAPAAYHEPGVWAPGELTIDRVISETEPNDSSASAMPVARSAAVKFVASFSSGADEDWYKVSVDAGYLFRRFKVTTSGGDASTDTAITIFRPDGTTALATSDDSGLKDSVITSGVITTAGTYFVKVHPGATGATAGAKYDVVFDLIP